MKKYVALSFTGLCAALVITFLLAACGSAGLPPAVAAGDTAAATLTTAATPGSSHHASSPLTSLRMLDTLHGWALTKNGVVKTLDGGVHWQDVTPAAVPANGYDQAKGDFVDMQNAWIASIQPMDNKVTVQHTADAGQHWQTATINTNAPAALDVPHFLNAREGWLEVIGHPAAGSQGADIFHSTDGGLHWDRIASTEIPATGLARAGFKSGISFANNRLGFATTRYITGLPSDPGLSVTRDGGHTWQREAIPLPQNTDIGQIGTTPPVFFGSTGFLPVYVSTLERQNELILYRTNDNGTHWLPTGAAHLNATSVYVLDTYHAWASDGETGKFYYTVDSGISWWPTSHNPGKFDAMSFIDANHGWAITDNALLHTTDAGKHWATINYTINA